MQTIVAADQRVFYGIFARSVSPSADPIYVLDKGERTPFADLTNVLRGDPADPQTYAELDPALPYAAVVYRQTRADAEKTGRAIQKALPRTSLLFFGLEEHLPDLTDLPNARSRAWETTISGRIADEVRMLHTVQRVAEVRAICDEAQKMAILLQHDPDPDAIASGLALRNVVGRNRQTAPMVTFGGVTRPENREMLRVLELTVDTITPEELDTYDVVACVDVQPAYFGEALKRDIAIVIDHHPEQTGYRTRYRDIRTSYGSTSTILTEYLRAAAGDVNEKQATALLYGVKSDTLGLTREVSGPDIEAFNFLYEKANLNALRRIEKPAIPIDSLKTFGEALLKLEVESGLSFAFLGEVEREDVIPQLAELLLQVEDAEWSVAAGISGDRLVASVRNAGYQKSAGVVVKRLFGDIGSAGGHRSMAKAVVPLERWEAEFGKADEKNVRKVFYGPFMEEATSSASEVAP